MRRAGSLVVAIWSEEIGNDGMDGVWVDNSWPLLDPFLFDEARFEKGKTKHFVKNFFRADQKPSLLRLDAKGNILLVLAKESHAMIDKTNRRLQSCARALS